MGQVHKFAPREHPGPEPVPLSIWIAGAAILVLVVAIMLDLQFGWSRGPDLPEPPAQGTSWQTTLERGYVHPQIPRYED